MEIIKTYPKNKRYRFIHPCCCEFIANETEFRWKVGQYNETVADVICPNCHQQFYADPEQIEEIDFDKFIHQ